MIGAHKSLQPERSFGPITMCLSMLYMFIQSFLIEKLEDFKLHVHDCEGVNISHWLQNFNYLLQFHHWNIPDTHLNLILQQDNYDPHPTPEPLSSLV